MKTPTIIRASLEPFCPTCGGRLEMQKEHVRTAYDVDTDKFLGFALICSWCRKVIATLNVRWRERGREK